MFEIMCPVNSGKVLDKFSFDIAKLLNLWKAKNIKSDSIVIKSENGTLEESILNMKIFIKFIEKKEETDKNDLEKIIFDLE